MNIKDYFLPSNEYEPRFLLFEHILPTSKNVDCVGLDIIKNGDSLDILISDCAFTRSGTTNFIENIATEIYYVLFFAKFSKSPESINWYELHLTKELSDIRREYHNYSKVLLLWKDDEYYDPKWSSLKVDEGPFNLSFLSNNIFKKAQPVEQPSAEIFNEALTTGECK